MLYKIYYALETMRACLPDATTLTVCLDYLLRWIGGWLQ